MENVNAKQKNQAAIERLNAEILALDSAIPAKLAAGEDVAEDLARFEALQRERTLRLQAGEMLEKAARRATKIDQEKARLATLESCHKAAKAAKEKHLKALEQILSLYNQADAVRKETMEAMRAAGYNEAQGSPAHVVYCDIGQILRTLSHGGENLPIFLDEIRAKLARLPETLDQAVREGRADLARLEG